jgi:hypothetical protein
MTKTKAPQSLRVKTNVRAGASPATDWIVQTLKNH